MTLGGVATGRLSKATKDGPPRSKATLSIRKPGRDRRLCAGPPSSVCRSRTVRSAIEPREISPWQRFLGAIRTVLAAQQPVQGRGLRLLTESVSSPTLGPKSAISWPLSCRQMASMGSGQPRQRSCRPQSSPRRISRRRSTASIALSVILSLDADSSPPVQGSLRYAAILSHAVVPRMPRA